jgi:hypothetical protein
MGTIYCFFAARDLALNLEGASLGLHFKHEKRFTARRTGVLVRSLSGEGKVVSVYPKAINIRCGQGLLVSLIEDMTHMTALSLHAPSYFGTPGQEAQAGALVRIEKGRLRLNGLCIDFAGGTPWEGSLIPGSVRGFSLSKVSMFREALLQQGKRGGLLGLIQRSEEKNPFVEKAAQTLREILHKAHSTSSFGDLSPLVGLGPGLTPSGDDFIAGVLLGEKILSLLTTAQYRTQRSVAGTKFEIRNPKLETNPNDQNPNDPNDLKTKTGKMLNKISTNRTLAVQTGYRQAVIPFKINKRALWQGLTRTNDAGRTLLFQTLRGYFPNYLIRVVKNLGKAQKVEQMAEAVGMAVSHGETSGTDALAGLLFYLNGAAIHQIGP